MIVARVLSIPYVVDGDTLWAQLEFTAGTTLDGREIIERDYAGGSKIRTTREDLTLNTPEKAKDPAGWRIARNECEAWCVAAMNYGPVVAHILKKEMGSKKDSFGRYLGDLVCKPGTPGEVSLVQHMRNMGFSGWDG